MIPTKAFWAEFKPINPATGLTVRVRICTLNTADATGIDLGNGEWLPYMSSFPDTEISVFDGQFDGVGESTLDSVQADDINQFALMFPSYIWDGTDVTVYKGSESTTTLGSLTKIFSGSVTETPSNEDDTVKWSIRDKSYLFDTEILKTTYAGTSGYEGTAEMSGVSKPFTLGEALNLEPILVDPAYLIYQYHGYGTTIGVQGLYENGLGFGAGQTAVAWAGSTAATFAALRAKVLTAGQWCDCPSIGMFRLGGEPVSGGVISCDVKGHTVGGVLIEKIDEAINLLIGLAPAAVGALVDGSSYTGLYSGSANQTVADYFTGPVNLGEILAKYLADCGAYHFINTAGLLRFGFVRMGTPALEIRTDGTAYPVPEDATVQPVSAPYKRIRMGADRVFRVHSLDEISDALYQAVSQLQTELTTLTNDYYLALNDDNLTIQEKIQIAIPTNTYYTNQYSELRPRAVSLGLSVTALDAAYNAYITDRNLISPAWNNTSLNSTGIPATFRANVAALGAALVAISVDISEEDAKRANWTTVTGTGKPSDNAGTSRILNLIGNHTSLIGNSIQKIGGTHAVFEGGVAGSLLKDTAFVSSSCLYDNANSGGWNTYLALDPNSPAAYSEGTMGAGVWLLQYLASNPNGTIILYKHNGTGFVAVNSWSGFGLTYSTRRVALCSNGRRVFAMVDGVAYGGNTSAYDITPGQSFYPKVLDFHRSDSIPLRINDIQYGNWDDARTYLDDGYTVLNQAGFKTDEGTASGVIGQGPGATAPAQDVLNYTNVNATTIIRSPEGGVYSYDNSITGVIKISLPQGYSNTMIRFAVDIFNYDAGTMETYIISGYNYAAVSSTNGYWINVSANYIGPETKSRRIRFGHDGSKACVWIGETTDVRNYPKIIIRDLMAAYANQSVANWNTGWAVTINTTAPANGSSGIAEVPKPRASDAVFGESIFESAGAATASLANFKTALGTAASIVSQGALATLNQVANGQISDGAITAIKLLTDSAVDIASIVPGSLNWRLSSSSSTDYSGGGWNGSGYNPAIDSGIIGTTGIVNASAGHRCTMKVDLTVTQTAPTGGSFDGYIEAYYRINGGSWVATGYKKRSGSTVSQWSGNDTFNVPSAGTIQFGYRLTSTGPNSGSLGNVNIVDHSLTVEGIFWK